MIPVSSMVGLVALVLDKDDDDIERIAAELPADRVTEALHFVTERRRELYQLEKMLRSRIAAEQLVCSGEIWTASDGREYTWGGDRERVCDDPAMLKSELEQVALSPVARIALKEAFKEVPMKVYLTHLDRIEKFGGEEAGRVIRAHLSWKEGSPKLRPLDEGKK